MNKESFLEKVGQTDKQFEGHNKEEYSLPSYSPDTHYLEITKSKYFKALTVLRHNVKTASIFYWSEIENAYNVDLFMMTSSVSSPMGPGSDSEAVMIRFGELDTFLIDSSQFGFEPIIMSGIEKVFCYLPSIRGENPDKNHLNQFFHCEAEILGPLEKITPQIEGYIKFLAETFLRMKNISNLLSLDSSKTLEVLEQIVNQNNFKEIEFDDAIKLLKENGFVEFVNETTHGKDILNKGELELMKLLNSKLPFWIKNFDRDRTAFYQKPDPMNPDKVINADLIFPPIIKNSLGGEIVGAGQRQDNYEEIIESLKRQGISPEPYEWYINLRKQSNYKITSGFGLGIERFIAWALCRNDIKDVILYPRLKNIKTYP